MARHAIRASRLAEPKAVIKAAPSEYERTHPVGSVERFLDQAAKEALAFAAAGGIPPPSRFIPGAVRAVAKEAEKYPDPLLAEAAGLPAKELARRAANAEAYRKAIDAQNAVVDTVSLGTSPAGNMAVNLLGAATHDALTKQDAKGGDTRQDTKAAETFDTPIPEELKAKYDAWYAQLPKNLQYTGDYDLQGAWLERLGQPDKYEAAQNGHLDDYGKKPNHITFSTGSKWHDPKVPERTGGEWKQAEDGSWDFYPGTGNKASDDELKAYFEKYEKGSRVHGREVRQDWEGGDNDEVPLRLSFDPGAVVDYRSMREFSGDPRVKDLYRSSPANFPHPIDMDPALRRRFDRDAAKSFGNQAKTVALVSALPVGGGASILGNAAFGGATGALASEGETAGEVARDIAIGAGVGAVATAAAPLVSKAVGRYMSWTDAGVAKAKEEFLREFVNAWAKKHNVPEEYAGTMARRARRPRPAMRLNTGTSAQAVPDKARPSVPPSSPVEQAPVPPSSPVEQPSVPPEAAGPALPELTDADLQAMAALDKTEIRRAANALLAQQDAEAKARWTADLVSRYGKERAALIESVMDYPLFSRYFYGDNKWKTFAQIQRLQDARKMVNAITEPNEIVVGGSAGISTEGTIFRNTAVPHDFDFSGYIGGASRRTDRTEQAVAEMMEALSDRSKIESSPIIQKLRKMYPELRDAKFRYADHDWQWSNGAQYEPGVFTVPKVSPDATKEGYANRLVTTRINGENVDIMLTDGALGISSTNSRRGSAEVANAWKRYYGEQRRSGLRLKDENDLKYYKPFSEDNRVIDLSSGRTQFSPDAFDAPLVNDDGLPTVFDVETFPGSGETVPVFMNTRGDMLIADDMTGLFAYDPTHPQNIAKYANIQATEFDKPLVAIRGAYPAIRADPRVAGEVAPSIGIYPANNLEALADDIIKGGRWSSTHASQPKDILIYPRSAIDPKSDVRNLLWDSDAYTDYVKDVLGPTGMEQLKQAAGDPKALDALARFYGEKARKPPMYYREIGNAYRNKIYEGNPGGRFNYTPEQEAFDKGYGEAKPSRYIPDYIRIADDEIRRDPVGARAKILEALKKSRFVAPLAVGAGLSAEATQQDAKGGDASRTLHAAQGAQDDVPPVDGEALATQPSGPRIVINPTTFHNKKDALCVAFNEGFRVWMEANGYEPQSEPTDAQRKFFSDTAYADDEVQLRRTILARIATFDTSVKDPTDDQLSETASFLGAVLESGWCRNDWERDSVSRLMNAVQSAVGAEPVGPRQEPLEAREAEPLQRHAAAEGRQ